MNRLISVDSPVMRFLSAFADLMLVNLLILVFSLPVFTVGAAVTAGCRITRDIASDSVVRPVRSFWQAFRENFRQATLVWIPHGIMLLGLSYNTYLFRLLLEPDAYRKMLVLLVALLVLTVGTGVYLYMLLSRYRNILTEHLKNALVLFFHYLPLSVGMACLNALPFVLFLFSPRLFLETFVLWAGFGFALILLLDNLMLKRVFAALEKSPAGEKR